jgi:ribonuclease HII
MPRPYAGIDEAGRGCLAGPVVAAAVILPHSWNLPDLNDSKKISPKKRQKLEEQIKRQAIAWSLGLSWPREIEILNILQATFQAMERAVGKLRVVPASLLVDGNQAPKFDGIPHCHIPHGDACVPEISAASIIAKTFRDRLMVRLSRKYPGYALDQNKGYGTLKHREALRSLGPSAMHRRTFKPVSELCQGGQLWLPGI